MGSRSRRVRGTQGKGLSRKMMKGIETGRIGGIACSCVATRTEDSCLAHDRESRSAYGSTRPVGHIGRTWLPSYRRRASHRLRGAERYDSGCSAAQRRPQEHYLASETPGAALVRKRPEHGDPDTTIRRSNATYAPLCVGGSKTNQRNVIAGSSSHAAAYDTDCTSSICHAARRKLLVL